MDKWIERANNPMQTLEFFSHYKIIIENLFYHAKKKRLLQTI